MPVDIGQIYLQHILINEYYFLNSLLAFSHSLSFYRGRGCLVVPTVPSTMGLYPWIRHLNYIIFWKLFLFLWGGHYPWNRHVNRILEAWIRKKCVLGNFHIIASRKQHNWLFYWDFPLYVSILYAPGNPSHLTSVCLVL